MSLNTIRELYSFSPESGFTLVELVVSLALIGITFVGIYSFYSTAYRTQEASEYKLKAIYLAKDLKEEIQFRLDQPNPPSDNNTGNTHSRLSFQTLGDYAGWSSHPPRDVAGNKLSAYPDMKRSVRVNRVELNRFQELEEGDGAYRKVTISISRDGQTLYSLPFYVMNQ